jgi:exodeoxyribonuclease VIII
MNAIAELAAVENPNHIFTPGIRQDLSNSDYHAIEALSATGIKNLLQSPAHYRYRFQNPDESATAAKTMGTALHMGILEPDRFDSGAVIALPEDAPKRPTIAQWNAAKPSPASVAAMAWWTEFNQQATGKIVLSATQAAIVTGMVASVRRHPLYDDLFSGGAGEVSYQWNDARIGIPCRCRFDYLKESGLALDVKTTRDASPDGFARATAAYGYHLQEAHYRNGYEHLHARSLDGFLFMAVENEAPFGSAIYVQQPNAINFALDRVEAAMLLYAQARNSGFWRGYQESIQPVVLPRWATSLVTPSY